MAVTLTVSELAAALRAGDSTDETAILTRLLAAATATIEHVADGAPEAIQNEACVRFAGYLYDQPNAGRGMAWSSAMRSSGALALVAPWRVHTAGIVGDADDDDEGD